MRLHGVHRYSWAQGAPCARIYGTLSICARCPTDMRAQITDGFEDDGYYPVLGRLCRRIDLCCAQHPHAARSVHCLPRLRARIETEAILALGFSVTAVILGGQTLTNVSDGKLPLAAAVVLVGIVSLIL